MIGPTGRGRDGLTYAVVALASLAAVSVDPNGHLLSENDVYMLRQVGALRELAPWRWTWGDPARAAPEAIFWIANLTFYFHGPLPPLFQAIFLDVAEATVGAGGTAAHFLSAGVFHAAACVLFVAALRRAGLGRVFALFGGLALCASPMFLAMGRGFGGSWLVGIVFGQTLLLHATLRAAAFGRAGGAWLALAIANLLLSDVMAPFGLAAAAAGVLASPAPARSAVLAALRSRWMLLPAACVIWILAANAYVAYRGVTHPSQVILFLYPFAQYLMPAEGLSPGLGHAPWSWAERARIVALVYGLGAIAAAPAVLWGATRARAPFAAESRLVFAWAATAALGFGVAFLGLAGPSTGSQAMPMIGYPLFILAPGVALGVLGLSTLCASGRSGWAAAACVVWICGSAIAAWIYVWRVDLPGLGAALTVREGTDVAGFRVPDPGIERAAEFSRAVLDGVASGQASLAIVVVAPRDLPLRNVLLWRAGAIDGGYFERSGRCVRRAVAGRGGAVLEVPEGGATRETIEQVARLCDTDICLGVGRPGASFEWRRDIRGEGGRSIAVLGFGVPQPPDAPPRIGPSDAPIGFMGAIRTGRVPAVPCPPE